MNSANLDPVVKESERLVKITETFVCLGVNECFRNYMIMLFINYIKCEKVWC